MTEKHSPLPWKNDSELIWCSEGPLARRPNHPENGQRWDDDAALIVRSVNALPELVAALADSRDAFEAIRLILINHLSEPERSAFWKAVQARDAAAAALAKVKGGSQPALTIDDVPSCGQENDYRKARK